MVDFLLAILVGAGLFYYIFKSKRFEEPIHKREPSKSKNKSWNWFYIGIIIMTKIHKNSV